MKDEEVQETLLVEAHRCIERAADETVARIGRGRRAAIEQNRFIDRESLVAYPPNGGLSDEEDEALRSMLIKPRENECGRSSPPMAKSATP
jgi:hypothetical protein